MHWKDIYHDDETWKGLQINVEEESRADHDLWLESGENFRFKLYNKNRTLFWGTFGEGFWGIWLLHNHFDWSLNEMPAKPISSQCVEESRDNDYYQYWSRHFSREILLGKPGSLANGLWHMLKAHPSKDRSRKAGITIHQIDDAIGPELRWYEWGGMPTESSADLIPLKSKPHLDNGRIKWFRKLAKSSTCPPILIWWLGCLQAYVILDGHCRLKAFQLENQPPRFLALQQVAETPVLKNLEFQENIYKQIDQRQRKRGKAKMDTREINQLLISAFDNRPYHRAYTRSTAMQNFDEVWTNEVMKKGNELGICSDKLRDFVNRTDY